jgi:hypothetical protein
MVCTEHGSTEKRKNADNPSHDAIMGTQYLDVKQMGGEIMR